MLRTCVSAEEVRVNMVIFIRGECAFWVGVGFAWRLLSGKCARMRRRAGSMWWFKSCDLGGGILCV